jgi:hypothetical protein
VLIITDTRNRDEWIAANTRLNSLRAIRINRDAHHGYVASTSDSRPYSGKSSQILTKEEDMVLNIHSLLIKTASSTEELNARPG